MFDLANGIRSLSDFKRNTADLMDRLRKAGHPLVPTIDGKAELVVQDAEGVPGATRSCGGGRRDSAPTSRWKGRVQSELRSARGFMDVRRVMVGTR
jgi:hypothetical protein